MTDVMNVIRLIGCISGEFSGNQWLFDTETESSDRIIDTFETLCAIEKYDEENRSNYLRRIDLQFQNLLSNTRFLFAPAKLKPQPFSSRMTTVFLL